MFISLQSISRKIHTVASNTPIYRELTLQVTIMLPSELKVAFKLSGESDTELTVKHMQ